MFARNFEIILPFHTANVPLKKQYPYVVDLRRDGASVWCATITGVNAWLRLLRDRNLVPDSIRPANGSVVKFEDWRKHGIKPSRT